MRAMRPSHLDGVRLRVVERIAALLESQTRTKVFSQNIRTLVKGVHHEIVAALLELGVPVAPVRSIPQVVKDPHVWEREMLVKMDDPVAGEIYAPGVTVKLSQTPGRVGPVPTPGQHTDSVLGGLLGMDAGRIASLRDAKVIA